MDALTFLKEYKRMCYKQCGCINCPIANKKGDLLCINFLQKSPEEAINTTTLFITHSLIFF